MSLADFALSQIKALQPYTPGKPVEELERELGISGSIKLASNENPLGYSRRVKRVINEALSDLNLYPDANAYYLKQALAQKLGVNANQLTIGNGSNDVLDLIARSFLQAGKEAIYSEYGFVIYPLVIQACGATARVAPALSRSSEQPFGHDLEAMLARITDKTAVIFIANPNNPTGTWLDKQSLYKFMQAVPGNIAVVIDEAYFEYVDEVDYPDASLWLEEFPNLIVTRTFSKIYGLAGLRLGYAISSAAVSDLLNRVRQPFNGNLPALAAGIEALQDETFVDKSRVNNQQGLINLKQYCDRKGLFYIPSVGNFLTVEFGAAAADIYNRLLLQGIIVRPLKNYRLDSFLRITIGTDTHMQRLFQALDDIL